MANDLSNPVQVNEASEDRFFEHGAGQDSLFSNVQLAQANPAPVAGQTIQVAAPQGAGPVVIRVEVAPGSIVELPQPFAADAELLAREGDGNLAIRVGDVTVILQGYVDANQEAPVTIEGADNQPIDIAVILASTDPAIDIQTAAGPADAGQDGQGADNNGAILAQLEDGAGLGGFTAAGSQDGTELAYRTIDASIRNDFDETLPVTDTFGFSVGAISGTFGEGFLRDPAQTSYLGSFATFLEEYQDAVEHPGQAMYAGWADYHGTGVTTGDFQEYLDQTSKTTTVDVNFTGATGDLVLTGIADGVQSNHSDLKAEFSDAGHTMFLRRESDDALVAVVHVEGPDADGQFTIQTFLINRLDHAGAGEGDAGKDSMDIEILFKVYDGPAQQLEGGENNDLPSEPTTPSLEGSFTASFSDDVPILEDVSYHNQHDMKTPSNLEAVGSGSNGGLIDEDWIRGGAEDKGADGNSNAGDDGDTGGGKCVTGCIDVNFGGDGAANSDMKGEGNKQAFVLDITQYQLGQAFPYGDHGLTSGGQTLVVLSVSGDHLTVGIVDAKQASLGDTDEGNTTPTDPIPGTVIFSLTLNQETGHFTFELQGPLDHGDSIFGGDSGIAVLASGETEDTIPLDFGVKAYDDDGDWVDASINIDVNDDVPVARDDSTVVSAGSHDPISGNVMTGAGDIIPASGQDSQGADHSVVAGVFAGTGSGGENDKVGTEIQGQYGKLTLNADGSYTYTRDAYSAGGVDDVFTYTLKDGDGDTSTATLTIHINDAEVDIFLPASGDETMVHEAGLPARGAEPEGSDAAADSEQTGGTITITAPDGIKTLEIDGTTLTLAELKDLGTNPHEIEDATGKLTLTGFDESTGALSYTYVLKDNTDASSVSSVSFEIKVSDVDDEDASAILKIDIVDDQPTANCDTIAVDAPQAPTTDIQFIIDVSGSMENYHTGVSGYPDNAIGLVRYAIEQMLNGHPEIQNVQFVLFNDCGSHSVWMTAAEALDYVQNGDNFDHAGGATNYDLALTEAMGAFDDARPLPQGDQSLVYFFSDGNPNEPHSDPGITNQGTGASQVSIQEWTGFVNANGISNVFAVGIGNLDSGERADLSAISYPDTDTPPAGQEDNLLNISSAGNLGTLLGSLNDVTTPTVTPVTGNVLDNDVSGADGYGDGKLTTVSYEGSDYLFNATTHEHSIDLGAGRGTLVIKDDGTYAYTPPAKNANGKPFYVEYMIQDGDGDVSTAKLKIDINTRPETDLNGFDQGADNSAHFVEDNGAVKISPDGTINDDSDIHSMTVTLTNRPDGNANEGLSLNVFAQQAVDDNGLSVSYANGVLTISGAPVATSVYQTILQGILYNNSSEAPNETDRHITVVVNDGTFDSVVHQIDLCVTSVNDAPDANIAADSYSATEDQVITLSRPGKMSISDVDAGNEDVTVTLSVSQGIIDVTKGNSGVTVTNDETGSVKLTGSVAEINALLNGTGSGGQGKITYLNTSDSPQAAVTLTLTVNDKGENGTGGAKSDTDTATINVANVNDKPVTDLNGNSYGADHEVFFQEDGGAIPIAPAAVISDDTGKLLSMTVGLASRPDGALESLSLNSAAETARSNAGISISNVNGVITLTSATPVDAAVFQTILRGIVYNNDSNTPNTNDRTVTVTVKDEGNLVSTSHTISVDVDPTNDAPVATMSQSVFGASEGSTLAISGKGLSISDVDSANDQMTVTLSVGQGVLNVSKGNSGVDSVTGSGTGTVTIKGSVTQINHLLGGVDTGAGIAGTIDYVNNVDAPAASTTLTFTVSDQGNNGEGGVLTDAELATINITAVNDAPTAGDDNVITNAGTKLFTIAEWALLYNDTDPDTAAGKLDLVSGNAALSNISKNDTATHTDGTDQQGYVSFTDVSPSGGAFDYKVHDGSNGSDTGHVTITQVSGSSVTGTSGDDIIIGSGNDDTLSGGSGGTDLIFGGAGDDTMIFGSADKFDGGTGFDQVKVTGGNTSVDYDKGSFLGVEMVDIGDTNDRSFSQNSFALDAGDLVAGATGTTLGGHSIALYVIGDNSGNSSGRDNVDLTGFNLTAVATNVSFKDSVTDVTHVFNIYEAAGGVKVAVEAGLDVS
jgi:VCBS repeat-containing protein